MERTGQQNIRLRGYLGTGALTGKALQERLSMSQTAISRAVQRNKKDILVIGAARSTKYALRECSSNGGLANWVIICSPM